MSSTMPFDYHVISHISKTVSLTLIRGLTFDYHVISYSSKTSKHLIKHITQYSMSVIDLTFRLSNQPQFSLIYWITDLNQSFRIVIIEFTNRLSVLYYVCRQPVGRQTCQAIYFFIFSFLNGRARLLTYCNTHAQFRYFLQ